MAINAEQQMTTKIPFESIELNETLAENEEIDNAEAYVEWFVHVDKGSQSANARIVVSSVEISWTVRMTTVTHKATHDHPEDYEYDFKEFRIYAPYKDPELSIEVDALSIPLHSDFCPKSVELDRSSKKIYVGF